MVPNVVSRAGDSESGSEAVSGAGELSELVRVDDPQPTADGTRKRMMAVQV